MIGEFTAFYLSNGELRNIQELNKRFQPTYTPYIQVKILSYFNEETFRGIISFGDRGSVPQYITKFNNTTTSIMTDYYDKKEGVFTFDGVRYFKIINTAVESGIDGNIVCTFKYLNRLSFSDKDTVFMIMPFGNSNLNAFYKKNIKQYLENSELKIKTYRSDDFTGTDVVADTILEQITKAEFVICDITNCNKNVFFEIGYAKGLSKNIIFLLEHNKPSDFFDVNHIRRIEYSFDREEEFKLLLKDTMISIRNMVNL